MTKFQEFARKNYKPLGDRDEMWHNEIVAECDNIDKEETDRTYEMAMKAEADRARIVEVVEKTADINAELAGRIVVKVSFTGSLPKTKKLTKLEKELVMKDRNADIDLALVGGDKKLFTSKEYDELASFVSERRDEFAKLGIPHIKFQSAHVVDITRIPEIDELASKTERGLAELVDKLIEVYPSQITPEATKLGPLYNARDYATVESLKGMFKFEYDWMAFGVPDELKRFDKRIYEKARAKAEKAWKEIEANGVLLLRQTISDMIGALIESLTMKDDGTKKKFYASSVTKIRDFCESFAGRNICGDTELDELVVKLNDLASGIDLKAMSTDMKLRESVKVDLEAAKSQLSGLLVDAEARVFRLED